MIDSIFSGVLVFFALTALVILKAATVNTRPLKDEPFIHAVRRLWHSYRTRVYVVFVAPWFWGCAGVWTAFVIAYTVTHPPP